MALVECRECGKSVSGEAKSCPNCGINAPNPEIFNLLETAKDFGVSPGDFDSYDAEKIREKARDYLAQVGLEGALAEQKKQKAERRKSLIFWGFIGIMLMSFAVEFFGNGSR